ncbi:MAG: C4-type zinc ribbon domain-containing protein [Thermodesulfobacteriota bacterium]|nr:C4-type zinc ribbon domain-containing protein [Thermodesulfobacteriota bacterium]
MREHLELLWELQKIDLDLKNIEEERDRYPKEMKKLDEKRNLEKERIHKEREKLESLEKERRQKEKHLIGEQDKIKRSEGRMSEVKTNKEYQAILTEIETFKEAVGRVEEEILLIMDEVEELKKQLSKREKEIAITLEKVEAEKRGIQEKMGQGEVLWKEKLERKEALSKQVESKLFKLYNMLREKRQGIGMVSARNETCQGCFVHVPPQMFIEVQKNLSLIRCPNCNRILHWDGNGEKK